MSDTVQAIVWCTECLDFVALPATRDDDKLGAVTDVTAAYNDHEFAHVRARIEAQYGPVSPTVSS